MTTIRIYSAPTVTLAQLLVTILEQHGINAWLKNEHLAGLSGLLPHDQVQAEVWIGADQWETAQNILAEFGPAERGQLSLTTLEPPQGALSLASGGELSTTEAPCPHCGAPNPTHFEVCWSCENDLSPPA